MPPLPCCASGGPRVRRSRAGASLGRRCKLALHKLSSGVARTKGTGAFRTAPPVAATCEGAAVRHRSMSAMRACGKVVSRSETQDRVGSPSVFRGLPALPTCHGASPLIRDLHTFWASVAGRRRPGTQRSTALLAEGSLCKVLSAAQKPWVSGGRRAETRPGPRPALWFKTSAVLSALPKPTAFEHSLCWCIPQVVHQDGFLRDSNQLGGHRDAT